ncbi:GDSL-type esterase/lipase family protein [Sporolactobacillus nakayamae]|uniref:Lysophospholipase L1 n=1 Tax=Sporolactobacillus nakayamae TaxID=269670 RepID=A0A1I2P3S2_9BACL|nr:GDSL-type esterase/lipase family protein [Sporolactobacillus nakayamae]SFG10862.1 Lysophospholipase L1 [Sporolactobacillus nakayamae]
MKKKFKILLVLSILINLLCLSLGSVIIIKKGGISYIEQKIKPNIYNGTPFHEISKSAFSILPVSSSSIVFAGDSITNFCNWNELFKDNTIINRGIQGETTKFMLDDMDNITRGKPDKIFLMIGINDLASGRSVSDTFTNYKKIINEIENRSPDTAIFIESVLPINTNLKHTKATNEEIVQFNQKISILAKEKKHHYIDLYTKFKNDDGQLSKNFTIDGVHLNGKGYLHWKKYINTYVR